MQQEPLPGLAPQFAEIADFPGLWRTLNEYKWGVLGVALIGTLIGSLLAYSQEPIYRATLVLQIESKSQNTMPVEEVYDPIGAPGYMGTQYEIMRSRELAGRVVDRMNLLEHPEFNKPPGWSLGVFLQSWQGMLPFLPAPAPPAAANPELKRELVIDQVVSRIGVAPIAGTQLARVYFQASTPAFAMAAVNTLGDLYIESGLEARLQVSQRASRWLTEKLAELRTTLEASEAELQKFREQHQIVNVGGTRGLLEDEVLDATRRLREAQKRRTELASAYQKIREAGGDRAKLEEVSAVLLDPTVQKTKEAVVQAVQGLRQTEERYGEKHPQYTAARARLEAAEKAYHEQLKLSAENFRADYEISQENERVYQSALETSRNRIREMDRRQYDIGVLERDVATNREIYNTFLTRFKETDSTDNYNQIASRIVDPAVLPRVPYKPDRSKIIALWTILGLIVGALLAVLRYHLDEGIRSHEDVEHVTGLPILAVLPLVRGVTRKKSIPALFIESPRTPFAEGIHSARAGVKLSDVDKRLRTIMVTSTVPDEGKSSIASCLALAFGAFERVLLIEGDLRAPSIAQMFGIPTNRPGLMELLSGQAKFDDCVVKQPSGVYILPVTQLPLNPAEVLSSVAFQKLLESLATHFDRVIIDAPPCLAASDSAVIGRLANAAIMVVKADTTNRRAVRNAVKHLRQARAPLFGAIINQVDTRHSNYYDAYHYAYGYYGKT